MVFLCRVVGARPLSCPSLYFEGFYSFVGAKGLLVCALVALNMRPWVTSLADFRDSRASVVTAYRGQLSHEARLTRALAAQKERKKECSTRPAIAYVVRGHPFRRRVSNQISVDDTCPYTVGRQHMMAWHAWRYFQLRTTCCICSSSLLQC